MHFRIHSHKPAHLCFLFWYPFVPKCACFPQNCRVQTVLQTSYESWRFWLHRVVTVRGKQRKTDQDREESICFHPKPSRGSLMPAILGKTAATYTDTQSKYTEHSGGLLGSRVWSLTTTTLKFLLSKRSCAICVFCMRWDTNSILQPNFYHFNVSSLQSFYINSWGMTIIERQPLTILTLASTFRTTTKVKKETFS